MTMAGNLPSLNSSPPIAAYMYQWTGSSLVEIMACRLYGAKPLSEPMQQNCRVDPSKQILVKFESKYKTFHSWKCIWNCCPRKMSKCCARNFQWSLKILEIPPSHMSPCIANCLHALQIAWNSVHVRNLPIYIWTSRSHGHQHKPVFLHDRQWISPWIKSISNKLDVTIHVISSQLSGQCDVISNRLWRHQQNENWADDA